MNIFGATKCGKTHLIAAILKSLTSRFTPDQVKFIVVDLKGSKLLDAIDEDYLLRWEGTEDVPNPEYRQHVPGAPPKIKRPVARTGLVANPTDLAPVMVDIAASMENRRLKGTETVEERRARSWWTGPEIFIVVDDYAAVANAAPTAFAPLAPHWGNAPMLGVHAVVACPMTSANRALQQGQSLPRLNYENGGSNLLMDGLRNDGPVLNIRLERRQRGRGILLTTDGQDVIQTPVLSDLEDQPPG